MVKAGIVEARLLLHAAALETEPLKDRACVEFTREGWSLKDVKFLDTALFGREPLLEQALPVTHVGTSMRAACRLLRELTRRFIRAGARTGVTAGARYRCVWNPGVALPRAGCCNAL